jgi:RHS repeat-associated protein
MLDYSNHFRQTQRMFKHLNTLILCLIISMTTFGTANASLSSMENFTSGAKTKIVPIGVCENPAKLLKTLQKQMTLLQNLTSEQPIKPNGMVVWSAMFDAFGRATVDDRSSMMLGQAEFVNNLRFAGQYFDEESGLHYNLMRYYDPDLGRYLTVDPLGVGGGSLNLYEYAKNNPALLVDPRGELAGLGALFMVGASASMIGIAQNIFLAYAFVSGLNSVVSALVELERRGCLKQSDVVMVAGMYLVLTTTAVAVSLELGGLSVFMGAALAGTTNLLAVISTEFIVGMHTLSMTIVDKVDAYKSLEEQGFGLGKILFHAYFGGMISALPELRGAVGSVESLVYFNIPFPECNLCLKTE